MHIGYEESLNIQFRSQFKEIISELDKIFEKVGRIKEIIILGDLKHEHGRILDQEWLETGKLLDYLKQKTQKIVLIRGNHDKILEPIADKKEIKIVDYYIKEEFGFIHGDINYLNELKDCKTIFLGHLHPAISIVEDVKKEIYKCFLVGKFKGKEIVILPSFFPLVEGIDFGKEENNLAFDLDLENFKVFIPADDSVLDFGKVRDVGQLK